jgi:glycosyltransferase involved in cell wall biosynthesis
MKILVLSPRSINHSRAGGAEIYLNELLTRVNNHEIIVLSSSDRRIYIQPKSYLEIIVAKNEFLFPFFSLQYLSLIKQADIVIESISKFPLIFPLIVSRIIKKPFIGIIYHIHGESLFKELPFIVAFILVVYEKLALKFYAILGAPMITISKSTQQELENIGFSPEKITVIPVGLNIQCQGTELSKSDRPLIVYIGRIKKYKRLDHLLKAFAIVKETAPNASCIIAGKADEKVLVQLEKLAKRLGIERNVSFKKDISEVQKVGLLTKAWVYVIPSTKEGFSISALEAQACGTPVVGYAIPGLVDCVKNGVTGFLVRDGDYEALAQAIKILLLNKDLRLKMSENAKVHASNFQWDISAKKFILTINRWLYC